MPITKAHCNTCGGDRNHEILHSESTSWEQDDSGVSGCDVYETLKCCGCEAIRLRHTSGCSENENDTVYYYPPVISRKPPEWFSGLWRELGEENEFVEDLLMEIYIALQNGLDSLATMGVRALLEKIMISKGGDQGSFSKNVQNFEKLGHVSPLQRVRLETILDAGHAVMHRAYCPSQDDVITLINITEHIIESTFIHGGKIEILKNKVPKRA